MPPMPPGIGGWAAPFFGSSATIASVVIKGPAIEAAPCRAFRTTLAHEASVFTGLGVVTETVSQLPEELAGNNRTVFAGILKASEREDNVAPAISRTLRPGPQHTASETAPRYCHRR